MRQAPHGRVPCAHIIKDKQNTTQHNVKSRPGPLSSSTGVARPYMPPSSLMRGLAGDAHSQITHRSHSLLLQLQYVSRLSTSPKCIM